MISKSNLLGLIKQGENTCLEFKSSDVRADSVAREIVSLANKDGGTLLLGVSDDGQIEGLTGTKDYEEWVANISRNNVIPAIDLDFSVIIIHDKKIGVISVPKGKDKPYQTTDGKYYIRVGSTNRIATQAEMLRLFQASGFYHYDLTPIKQTGLKDLNFTKLDDYFERYKLNFSRETDEQKETLLRNVDILAENGQTTVAGMLIFGINPTKYLFQNGISFAYFRGNTIDEELIDKQNIDGNLDFQVETGTALLKNHIAVPSRIEGVKRKNKKYVYPEKVFREILTNALVHRNYSITGSKIRVFLFNNRLEVISPGRLPNTITIEKLRYGVSFAVNPVIVKFMENLNYIDQLGRGLPMVFHEATTHGKTVEFEEFGEEFKVILEI